MEKTRVLETTGYSGHSGSFRLVQGVQWSFRFLASSAGGSVWESQASMGDIQNRVLREKEMKKKVKEEIWIIGYNSRVTILPNNCQIMFNAVSDWTSIAVISSPRFIIKKILPGGRWGKIMHHFWPGRYRTLAKWEEVLVGPHAEETPCVCSFSQNFYKTELNKEEMYIRYIHKLYDLHLKAQNFTGNSAWGSDWEMWAKALS